MDNLLQAQLVIQLTLLLIGIVLYLPAGLLMLPRLDDAHLDALGRYFIPDGRAAAVICLMLWPITALWCGIKLINHALTTGVDEWE